MPNYWITLSDGKKVWHAGASAAQAIESARWTYRGRTVVGCYIGVKPEDVNVLRMIDKDCRPSIGWIDHEVPPHDPIPEGAQKPRVHPRMGDEQGMMFDDEAIKEESQKARDKRDHSENQPIL